MSRQAALLAVMLVLTAAATTQADAHARSWIDRRGLAFVSQEAFCAYHCSAAHVAQAYDSLRATSECTEADCGRYLQEQHALADAVALPRVRRRLRPMFNFSDESGDASMGDVHAASEDGEDVTVVDLVACSDVADVSLSIGDPETDEFADFYDAFFTAYDAMLSGTNSTVDACQLQFLQQELLANYSSGVDDDDEDAMEVKPTLVKLNTSSDENACLDEIREVWPPSSEAHTPFLTRSDQSDANTTVLLMHFSAVVGDDVLALECVDSVTVLPAILKLTPFARSSVALSKDSNKSREGPALELRLAKAANTTRALSRLSKEVTSATGISNLLSARSGTTVMGGTLLQTAVDDFDTWTQALALVLDDEAVEWVDLQQQVTLSALHTRTAPALEQRMLRQWTPADMEMDTGVGTEAALPTIRRLDDYVQDVVGVTTMQEHNITGSSIIVGITDTGLYMDHDQFDQDSRDMYDSVDTTARKVIYYRTFANDEDEAEGVTCGHGTHVSGILAGSSLSQEHTDLGIASSARIAFMDIGKQDSSCAGTSGCEVSLETPGEVSELMAQQVDTGAQIFSFSWGTGANDYNTQTAEVDEYVHANPEVLIVVAAGNSGESGSYTISSPSGAKNVISVGASLNAAASFSSTPCASVLNEKTVASFSSIGPMLDGRQKPDLVAPGMTITSAQSLAPGSTTKTSETCSLQGTSQATPVVAGMAVLLYEWLRDGWWYSGQPDARYAMDTIPAALLKALLLHSSEALSRRLVEPSSGVTSCVALEAAATSLTSYPDFSQGYGKPTMLNVVSFPDSSSSNDSASGSGSSSSSSIYFYPNSSEGSEPSVTEGEEVVFNFILTSTVNLRVTLVWTDPAGSVGSKVMLQNDLDLTLQVLNTTAVFYPLSGNGSRDSVNNVEMVEVTYDDVLSAAEDAGLEVDDEDGQIYVQAVVTGYSVKAGANATTTGQTFALVASSTPSAASTSSASTEDASFWQPWMTIGTIVLGTLGLLFLIAFAWRMRVRKRAEAMKYERGTPSARAALTAGAAVIPGRRNRRDRRGRQPGNNSSRAAATSQSHGARNYRNVVAGGSLGPAVSSGVAPTPFRQPKHTRDRATQQRGVRLT